MVGVWCWFLSTPAILWLGRRYPFTQEHRIRNVTIHFTPGAVLGIVLLAFEAAILYSLRLFPAIMISYAATLGFLLIIGYHQTILTYWTILGVQFGFGWYRRYEERRQEATRLELRSAQLERQLANAILHSRRVPGDAFISIGCGGRQTARRKASD